MKNIFLALIAFTFLGSCASDDNAANCLSYSEAYVDTVASIETADAAGFLYKVNFFVGNGCGGFGSFEETVDGNTITIKLIAKFEGCICTEAIEQRDAVYSFIPPASGTYTLKFKDSENTFITKMVTAE
ncbi:hypothetical protein J2X31_001797 [Flavobacterium arsenatis]|uniref:Lipoprotein n=1 Tax=Flavobacterium arsenatis TaxID=1484332 RepID=A0ABU1TPA0_9FLAO|nr:hypothetical protein [Flavobacterium arsenatis]MDR6967785.1 hypothetical protein [Flavobacterium arsenatis]